MDRVGRGRRLRGKSHQHKVKALPVNKDPNSQQLSRKEKVGHQAERATMGKSQAREDSLPRLRGSWRYEMEER